MSGVKPDATAIHDMWRASPVGFVASHLHMERFPAYAAQNQAVMSTSVSALIIVRPVKNVGDAESNPELRSKLVASLSLITGAPSNAAMPGGSTQWYR